MRPLKRAGSWSQGSMEAILRESKGLRINGVGKCRRASPPRGIASPHMTSYSRNQISSMVSDEPNCPLLHSPCRQATRPSERTGKTGWGTDTRVVNSNASARYAPKDLGSGSRCVVPVWEGPCCFWSTARDRDPKIWTPFIFPLLSLLHPYGFVLASCAWT